MWGALGLRCEEAARVNSPQRRLVGKDWCRLMARLRGMSLPTPQGEWGPAEYVLTGWLTRLLARRDAMVATPVGLGSTVSTLGAAKASARRALW